MATWCCGWWLCAPSPAARLSQPLRFRPLPPPSREAQVSWCQHVPCKRLVDWISSRQEVGLVGCRQRCFPFTTSSPNIGGIYLLDHQTSHAVGNEHDRGLDITGGISKPPAWSGSVVLVSTAARQDSTRLFLGHVAPRLAAACMMHVLPKGLACPFVGARCPASR